MNMGINGLYQIVRTEMELPRMCEEFCLWLEAKRQCARYGT